MIDRKVLERQLSFTLESSDFPQLGKKIQGKVRDSYVVSRGGQKQRILIASDRLSAFDRVLTTIPFKGQLLNRMAHYWFEQTKHIITNHIIDYPHPNVFIAREVKILPVEVIIRGYLTGSAWRDYKAGKPVSGITLPPGMKRSEQFETPLITPSTKAEVGEHDLPISSEEIVKSGLVEKKLWEQITETALKLFSFGSQLANKRGLVLVDTKYEFGVAEGPGGKQELVLADEVHTQDSSRFWILKSYADRFNAGEDPEMLDKEFVRRWLMEEHNYMGEGEAPKFTDDFRVETALKYVEAYEQITGESFEVVVGNPREEISAILKRLV